MKTQKLILGSSILRPLILWFQQPGYKLYSNLEQLVLKAAEGADFAAEFDFVCKFYKEDLDPENLRAQLLIFGVEFQCKSNQTTKPDTFDVRNYFRSLTSAQRSLLSEVCTILQLILIMPATNSTSERSFSALRRVKTYLRSTMSQQRLNSLMVLHVHKDITDTLDSQAVATDFIGESNHRMNLFGTYC